jgi:serine/threonine protein kinase
MDGLITGQCFTEHDGVHCYPAIRQETGEKYIIKVITIPANPSQTEAMLLAGAFQSREDAKPYFQTLAQEVVAETKTLNSLSLLEGFVGCEQVCCEETEEGYQVYILSAYRECAQTVLNDPALTHAEALRLALDLCAALTACRRAGFMYIDLKPDNIFKNEQNVYCIGDIGFTALRSLKYASLPKKYRSSYTAPEMADCFAQLNDTLDVYALGMVLYQAYNGGSLPVDGIAPEQELIAPIYADYELAEIILTACHADPSKRWADPAAMGQALRGYMERNVSADTTIIPPPPAPEPEEEEDVEAVEEFLPDMTDEELQQAMAEEMETPPAEEDELQLIAALAAEESTIGAVEIDSAEDTSDEETAQMLAQAEELMALIPPEPVVAPEAVYVPDPTPLIEALQAEPEQEEAVDELPLAVINEVAEEHTSDTPTEEPKQQKHSKLFGRFLAFLIILIILGGAAAGGYYYYTQIYQQQIDAIQITGTDSTAVITVLSDVDESLLTLLCIDGYGNSHPAKLVNGTATFENLNPQTRYTVTLRIDGFHELIGQTSAHFTTASRTEIQNFQASIGPVDRSVALNFTFSGPEPSGWKIVATAPDQETITQAFTGTAVIMEGLHIGSEYTFTLVPDGELYMSGQTQTSFTAVKLVFAQDPLIDSCHGGSLHITWSAPEDSSVESWIVHCYNASGYDQTVTVSDTQYTFTGLDHSYETTVEITAEGMNKSVSTTIGANPITIWEYPYTVEQFVGVHLGWTAEGNAPEGGWIVHWSVNGVAQQPITCRENGTLLPLFVPGGVYEITLKAANDAHIYGDSFSFSLPELVEFNMYGLTSADLRIRPFRAHAGKIDWTKLNKKRFVGPFSPDDDVKILLDTEKVIEDSNEEIQVQYILRNEDGSVYSDTTKTHKWNSMWFKNGCVLSPELPKTAGTYTLSLYFNGMFLADIPFTIA